MTVEHFADLRDEVDRAAQRFADVTAERDRLRAVVDVARSHVEMEDYPSEVVTFDRLVAALAQLDRSPDMGGDE